MHLPIFLRRSRNFAKNVSNFGRVQTFHTAVVTQVSNATKVARKRQEKLDSEQGSDKQHIRQTKKSKDDFNIRNESYILAQKVAKLTKGEQPKAALDLLVKKSLAPKTVAYNHLLGYHLRKGEYNSAWSLYNMMKKSMQMPNEFTYTILLQGLYSILVNDEAASKKKLSELIKKVYENLYRSNSTVSPNTIHINILAQCCLKLKDVEFANDILLQPKTKLDSSIASKVMYLYLDIAEMQPDRFEEMHKFARDLWEFTVSKYKDNEFVIHEDLLCSYAKILCTAKHESNKFLALRILQQQVDAPMQYPIQEPHPTLPGQCCEVTSRSLITVLFILRQLHDVSSADFYWAFYKSKIPWPPAIQAFHERLRLYVELKQVEKIPVLLREMREINLLPTAQTMAIAMSLCLQQKYSKFAQDIWELAPPNTEKIKWVKDLVPS
ncbi:mitochondrial PPR repeat protein Ppr2 [Schizosaccharomyces osmophilus]|uniref:Mitochondrial PPR repeat protein Ppr2 n=1 Tax=Schizosaccharomyces osmophilus TaxID=2545709 RepID=A0AAF0AW71_9SCHI|nr:mitochondrial PPR repeat protein Ppr2 [Schizosaccharomyces osmophilus]WBW73203.1 mitochondrial PPR repeat protein Ppr2 [Schizosaccharomyces osmophilus]